MKITQITREIAVKLYKLRIPSDDCDHSLALEFRTKSITVRVRKSDSLFNKYEAIYTPTSEARFSELAHEICMEEKARRESWVDNGRDDYPAEEDNSWEYHQYQAGVVGFENYKSDNY